MATKMNETDEVFEAVAVYFSVMSEPLRLKIMHAICQQERSVNQIAEELNATQTNISRHLGFMYRCGVLARRKEGNQVFYSISDSSMVEICRAVCTRIAGQIGEQQPLRKGLLKLMPGRRKLVA
jgi:DNA-binding transcriptional ArsR family regulator